MTHISIECCHFVKLEKILIEDPFYYIKSSSGPLQDVSQNDKSYYFSDLLFELVKNGFGSGGSPVVLCPLYACKKGYIGLGSNGNAPFMFYSNMEIIKEFKTYLEKYEIKTTTEVEVKRYMKVMDCSDTATTTSNTFTKHEIFPNRTAF